jgi:hypothetical protein
MARMEGTVTRWLKPLTGRQPITPGQLESSLFVFSERLHIS